VEMEKQFLILYGDNLTNTDLGKMVCFHMGHGDLFTMGLFNTNRATVCGIAELNQDGKILSFEEKPKYPKTNLAAAGVYVASPEIFELFPPETEHFTVLDLGLHILPKLVGRMYGYRIKEYLLDIGDLDSYYKAQIDWEKSLH
jgi:mannose-1-phosphate guanylyltransferase